MEIRTAIKSDVSAMVELNIQCWEIDYRGIFDDMVLQHRREIKSEQMKRWEGLVEQNRFYVAIQDTILAGFISIGHGEYQGVPCGEVQSLYVAKTMQGIGIGKQLFQIGLEQLQLLGYENYIVKCLNGTAANHFYQQMGAVKHQSTFREELGKKYLMNIYLGHIKSLKVTQ